LNKHLEELIELSQLDKSIDDFTPLIVTAQKKLARRVEKRDDILKRIDSLNQVIGKANSSLFAYEEQIKTLQEQLKRSEEKERVITTEKEMQALSLESELAKEKLIHANEEIARQNKIIDSKNDELSKVQEELDKSTQELEKISTEVDAKLASIDRDKGKLFNKREAKTMTIDMKILSFYEKIRVWARNTAVVPVRKQACYGCYMKLNDSTYATVIKSEEIITCPHCGRIIYIEPQTAEIEA